MASKFGDTNFTHWAMDGPEKFDNFALGTCEHGALQVRSFLDGLLCFEGGLLKIKLSGRPDSSEDIKKNGEIREQMNGGKIETRNSINDIEVEDEQKSQGEK